MNPRLSTGRQIMVLLLLDMFNTCKHMPVIVETFYI